MIYTILWALWLAAFALIEGTALFNKRAGDTFSERTRRWFAVHTKPGRAAFFGVWVGFAVWYLVHIIM